jgi:putative redox protein
MENLHTVKANIGQERYRTELRTTNHLVISDEGTDVGGADLGFTPTDLLAASLAACTSITLRMYAERKGWSIGEIDVKVSVISEKNGQSLKTIFKRELTFEGEVPEDQRQRLLQIANVCPIHKTLTNPIDVLTELG